MDQSKAVVVRGNAAVPKQEDEDKVTGGFWKKIPVLLSLAVYQTQLPL